MSDENPEIPQDVLDLIGKPLYPEETEFDIEMGYVYNTLAAVQNGNPLYWDKICSPRVGGGPDCTAHHVVCLVSAALLGAGF